MKPAGDQPNINQNAKLIASIRRFSMAFFVVAFFAQVLILPDWENIFCAALASVTSIFTFSYVLRPRRFASSPFSMVMLIGYNLGTSAGTLFAQMIGWRALTFNLEVPVLTFALMAVIQFLAIGCHVVYVGSAGMGMLRRRISKLYGSWGLFTAPSNFQLWFFGVLGCLASWLTTVGQYGNVHFGQIGFQFLNGFTPFVVAPFLIPIVSYLLDGSGRPRPVNWFALALYFALICLTAIGRNSRAAFAVSVLVLLIAICLAIFLGRLVVKRRYLLIAGLCAIPFWLGASALSDLATAMVLVRGSRMDISAGELIRQTLDEFQDKNALKRFRDYETSTTKGYNEIYIENVFLARFVYTKFIDLNLALAEQLDDQGIVRVRDEFVKKLLAQLPTPILNVIDPNLNKEDLQYSSGDFYNGLVQGDRGIGWYRTGSVLADGFVVLSWFYIPVLAVILFIKFIFFDALTARARSGHVILATMGILFIFPIFTFGIMDESLAGQIGGILRGIPQTILLYLLAFHGSHIFSWMRPRRLKASLQNTSSASRV